jgi:hypothetical protein
MQIAKSTYIVLYKTDQDNYWSQRTIIASNIKEAADKFTKEYSETFPFRKITGIEIQQY